MDVLIGIALLGAAVTGFLASYQAVRSVRPPWWTSENMLMTLVAPVIMYLGIGGGVLLIASVIKGTWRNASGAVAAEIVAVLIAYGLVWFLMVRRWRRASRANAGATIHELHSAEPPAPAQAPAPAASASDTPLKAA